MLNQTKDRKTENSSTNMKKILIMKYFQNKIFEIGIRLLGKIFHAN